MKLAIQKLNWHVTEELSTETGFDLIVLARNDRRVNLRAIAAAQVNSGLPFVAQFEAVLGGGTWDERHGHLPSEACYDAGYRAVMSP